jgi:hypothetical protein
VTSKRYVLGHNRTSKEINTENFNRSLVEEAAEIERQALPRESLVQIGVGALPVCNLPRNRASGIALVNMSTIAFIRNTYSRTLRGNSTYERGEPE